MTAKRSNRSQETKPATGDLIVTPEEGKVETKSKASAPVNIEVETPSEEPEVVTKTVETEKVQTDVRAKLAKKTDKDDPFVPANPAALEKAAAAVAQDKGFEMNRGTSVGARLIARAQNRGQ
jgi:hypothetical protein